MIELPAFLARSARQALERVKGVESIRDYRPVSSETGVISHESMSSTRNVFSPARNKNTFSRSNFVIRSHARGASRIACVITDPCCDIFEPQQPGLSRISALPKNELTVTERHGPNEPLLYGTGLQTRACPGLPPGSRHLTAPLKCRTAPSLSQTNYALSVWMRSRMPFASSLREGAELLCKAWEGNPSL
jgi:hypothetical protein